MQVTHDKKLLIAIGRSRKAVQWQNKEMLWSEFLDKLANTTRTRETVNDYAAMTKAEREKPSMIDPKRKRRIAAGSGTRVEDVNRLLRQFEQMTKMMKQLKKNPKRFQRGMRGMFR